MFLFLSPGAGGGAFGQGAQGGDDVLLAAFDQFFALGGHNDLVLSRAGSGCGQYTPERGRGERTGAAGFIASQGEIPRSARNDT